MIHSQQTCGCAFCCQSYCIPQFGQHARGPLCSYVGFVGEPETVGTNGTSHTFSTVHCVRPLISAPFPDFLKVTSRTGGAAGTVAPVHHGNIALRQSLPLVQVHDLSIVPFGNLSRKDPNEHAAVKIKLRDLAIVIVLACRLVRSVWQESDNDGVHLRRRWQWHQGRVGSA